MMRTTGPHTLPMTAAGAVAAGMRRVANSHDDGFHYEPLVACAVCGEEIPQNELEITPYRH